MKMKLKPVRLCVRVRSFVWLNLYTLIISNPNHKKLGQNVTNNGNYNLYISKNLINVYKLNLEFKSLIKGRRSRISSIEDGDSAVDQTSS